MKKRTKYPVVQINFNIMNNKVSTAEGKTFGIATAIYLLMVIVAALVISHCCPELLTVFIRWILSTALGI